MRRVITGHREGKSVIVEDAEVPVGLDYFGMQLIPIWRTEVVPLIPLKQTDFDVRLPDRNFGSGEVYSGMTVLPPDG